jgi:chromosome segregation ATPase
MENNVVYATCFFSLWFSILQAARQAEILAARAAEVEHLKAENAILAATLRDEAQAAQVAVSAFENTRQKVEGDVHDMRARQNVLVEMNASLQESCEFLKKELQIANEKAVRSEIESTLATERAKSLQDELNTLLLRQPPNHPAEQTVSDGAREYQGQASPSRVENGHSLGLPDLLHKDQAEADISDDERHVKVRATNSAALNGYIYIFIWLCPARFCYSQFEYVFSVTPTFMKFAGLGVEGAMK